MWEWPLVGQCSGHWRPKGGRPVDCFLGYALVEACALQVLVRGHGDRVVTLSPPTSEAGVRSPSRPQVGKLVVACRWLAVYSTEP